MAVTAEVDWEHAQVAVEQAARRVCHLLRTVRHPSAPALGVWDVTDVAAHLSHAVDAVIAMAHGGGGLLQDIVALSDLTEGLVQGEAERDLNVLAGRIEASASRFVELPCPPDGSAMRTWLVRGVELPLPTLACHVLNELVVHGRDIAVAEGAPWPISRAEAVLVLCGFLFPVIRHLGPMVVDQEAASGVRATYDVRVRGGCRVSLRFDDGDLSVTDGTPAGPVDCHLSVDPAAFLLVAWGRLSQWGPICRGKFLAWGRRPWLGPKLRTLLTNP